MGSKILIVDDHEVVRQGIRTILRARPQWEVCGEAVNGRDAIEKTQSLDPDVIIMDITMPEMSGIEATREITKLKLRAAVLVFTMHESKNLSTTVQDAGARGFVLKSHAARDLLDALEALMAGGTFFGPDPGKTTKSKEESGNRGLTFCAALRPSFANWRRNRFCQLKSAANTYYKRLLGILRAVTKLRVDGRERTLAVVR
jgi:DNA-binding NarL/FixJ family response regulator